MHRSKSRNHRTGDTIHQRMDALQDSALLPQEHRCPLLAVRYIPASQPGVSAFRSQSQRAPRVHFRYFPLRGQSHNLRWRQRFPHPTERSDLRHLLAVPFFLVSRFPRQRDLARWNQSYRAFLCFQVSRFQYVLSLYRCALR